MNFKISNEAWVFSDVLGCGKFHRYMVLRTFVHCRHDCVGYKRISKTLSQPYKHAAFSFLLVKGLLGQPSALFTIPSHNPGAHEFVLS